MSRAPLSDRIAPLPASPAAPAAPACLADEGGWEGGAAAPPAPPPAGWAAGRRLGEGAAGAGCPAALDSLLADPNLKSFLGSALGDCPYLLDLATKDVARLAETLTRPPEARLEAIIAGIE